MLFYPGAGNDWREPLEAFAPEIASFWFVDIRYFTRCCAGAAEPLVRTSRELRFEGFRVEGPALAALENRVDSERRQYRYLEPCTRTEVYTHLPTNRQITIHRRRGFGERSIALVPEIAMFVHRRDSPGEAGSNVFWLSRRRFPEVTRRLSPYGMIVSDGSLSHVVASVGQDGVRMPKRPRSRSGVRRGAA